MKHPAALSRMPFTPIAGILALLVLSIITPAAFGQTTNPPQDPQQPTIKIPTALVNVPVMVTDNYGRFAIGLRRGDFTVREDGVVQKIEDFSSIEAPFNVALLIDTSHSTQNKLGAIRKAALAFIKQLLPNDRVMVVTFDDKVQFVSEFTSNHADLERAVKSVKSSYATSLYDAIYRTINEKMVRISGRKAIVLLTDGVDTASKVGNFENTLDLVAATGIISYAIQYETRNDGAPVMKPIFLPGRPSGFVSNFSGTSHNFQVQNPAKRDPYLVASDFLRSLAAQSGALYMRAENIENTSYAFQRIADELHHQYTLTYVSSNEQRDGKYRSINVEVSQPGLLVRPRLGYRVPKSDEPEAEKKTGDSPKP
ncbi:MAG: VWA domain-containing protein [Acidobacteriota bacterium]